MADAIMLRRLVLLGLAAFVGCSSPSARSSSASTGSAAKESDFDRNDILDDASMTQKDSPSAAQVQALLERTPYGQRSVLADYAPKGKDASQVIVDTAQEYGLSPMVLLVRLQIESQLVSKTKAAEAELDRAFRCGCDGEACTDKLLGFENQARCAASSLADSLDQLRGPDKQTTKGWAKGQAKKSDDGVVVTPANDATAALYEYLGNVGRLGGGSAKVAGTSAFWQLWSAFTAPKAKDAGAADADVATALDGGGCRVVSGVDPCGAGARCSRSDGLVGTCIAQTCACAPGRFCDDQGQCVQCTPNDTSSCRAEGDGDRCMPDGTCGCRTSGDCGFDRKRVCDPFRNVCMDDPLGAHDTSSSADDAGTTEGKKPVKDAGVASAPETPAPASTPDVPEAPSSSPAKDKTGDESSADLPDGPSESSGCREAPGAPGGGALVLSAALAAWLTARRRRSS